MVHRATKALVDRDETGDAEAPLASLAKAKAAFRGIFTKTSQIPAETGLKNNFWLF